MSFPRFLKLVAQGDSDTVLEYLEEHADDDHLLQNINRPQPKLKHHTCLTYAVHVLADVGMVKNLLEGPLASTISAVAEDGQSTTPVDYAVLGGNRHMVELVLGVGNGVAGPRCKQYFEGEEGRLVGLFAAASAELPDEQAGGMVVLLGRLLLLPEADKPRINFAEGEGGRHVIYHTLAGENKAESLGVVLGRAEAQAWFGSAMVEDSLGVSPLRLAIEEKCSAAALALIAAAAPNELLRPLDSAGNTALHLVMLRGSSSVLEGALLSKSPDLRTRKNNAGRTYAEEKEFALEQKRALEQKIEVNKSAKAEKRRAKREEEKMETAYQSEIGQWLCDCADAVENGGGATAEEDARVLANENLCEKLTRRFASVDELVEVYVQHRERIEKYSGNGQKPPESDLQLKLKKAGCSRHESELVLERLEVEVGVRRQQEEARVALEEMQAGELSAGYVVLFRVTAFLIIVAVFWGTYAWIEWGAPGGEKVIEMFGPGGAAQNMAGGMGGGGGGRGGGSGGEGRRGPKREL